MIAPLISILSLSLVGLFIFLPPVPVAQNASLADPREKHLKNIRQLTNEGENAEAGRGDGIGRPFVWSASR